MQPVQQQTISLEPKRSRAGRIIVALIILALGGFWVAQTFRKGSFAVDPSAVTMVTRTRPADGERNVLPNAFISADLNAGHAIDPGSMDGDVVRLFRTNDRHPVPAQVNTTAAGDGIVLTPLQMLEPATNYTFEVDGVKDTTGADLMKFAMNFTTTAGAPATTYPAAFEKIDVPSDQVYYTGLTIGPDHKLYAGSVDGKIIRRDIHEDGTLGPSQIITTVQAANSGPRLITGICFDPKSTKDNLRLWISHGQFIMNERGEPSLVGATDWTGKISVISGKDLTDYQDVVTGLPRSWRDHLNNQIAFGPDGRVYWSQGSHTAMGAPDQKWGGNRVERLLSAAVLRLDPSKVTSTLDVKTSDGGGAYDPFAPGAPLTIYASGVRVGYDMLWHSNGQLYTAINGSAAGGNTPATPPSPPTSHAFPHRIDEALKGPFAAGDVLGLKGIDQTQPDLLLKLEQGSYYGHPNPLRGEYVLNGGNPTPAVDAIEVPSYPVGTKPDRNWHKPCYSFGTSVSPNGMLEYQSHGKLFGGALDGKLLITRFSGGKDIIVLSLDDQGNVTETITGITGLTNFTQPLDITQDALTGCIYVAEYGGEKLTLLRPITDAARMADLHQNVFRQQIRASVDE